MTPDQLFAASSLFVLPAWALLVVAPAWRYTRAIAAYLTPGALAIAYLTLMVTHFESPAGGFGTLGQLAATYGNPWFLLAGWIHLLAIDLFIGAWQVRDAQRLRIRHAYVIPCLVVTFLLGPAGLLVYFA